MGLYNTFVHEISCSNCNKNYESRSQFKYGDLWDYEYRVGERIRLRNDSEATWEIVAELWCDECPTCSKHDVRQLRLRHGTIVGEVPREQYFNLKGQEWGRVNVTN